MTERERWIVYPLLFLALGAALRDKLVDRTTTKSIVCQELTIVDDESRWPQSAACCWRRIGRTERDGRTIAASVGYLIVDGASRRRRRVVASRWRRQRQAIRVFKACSFMPAIAQAMPRGMQPVAAVPAAAPGSKSQPAQASAAGRSDRSADDSQPKPQRCRASCNVASRRQSPPAT